jgi:hypothetical protein
MLNLKVHSLVLLQPFDLPFLSLVALLLSAAADSEKGSLWIAPIVQYTSIFLALLWASLRF